LNLSYFIFKRITQSGSKGFSPAVFKIAIGSIAIGLAAMIVSFLIMRGFQETVRSKIFGFSGHLTITRFSMGYASEHRPINFHMDVYDHPEKYPLVKHTQEYINKTGLIKTDDEVLGVMVKGVGTRFDTVAFNENLVEGRFIHHPDSGYSNEVVISRTIANKLNANVNDRIVVHFFQNPPRFRRLTITGIYETNLTEYYDSRVILGDIKLLQRLNDWSDSLAEGVEIFIHHPEQIAQVQDQITTYFDENFQEHGDKNVESIEEKFINVFEWLELLNRQINIRKYDFHHLDLSDGANANDRHFEGTWCDRLTSKENFSLSRHQSDYQGSYLGKFDWHWNLLPTI
jgi:lipoprotein-releasing system permease protein